MSNVTICEVDDAVREEIRKFRFRKAENTAALILKVDRASQKILVDEVIEDTSLDDLQEVLPGHQPRFVIYHCRFEHKDGRVSFPMCFIYITPRDCQTELQIMYAGSKTALQREINLSNVYEIRELEELTDEWLQEKLQK